MEERHKRFALRMIPYGVHVVTTLDAGGAPVAATTHWVTQTSFEPALVTVALPVGAPIYAAARASNFMALHMLGRDDAAEALAFVSRPTVVEGNKLSGWGFKPSRFTGLPLLNDAPAVLELSVRAVIEFGDHHPFICEVAEAHVRLPEQERPDEMVLHLWELGETIFYGG
jgi:flavin reductase (DIM6/NTAB) family NADH-FMN oxidoreductase RutF